MPKLLYLKNSANGQVKQKFVFMAVEKPSAQPTGGGGPASGSLAETMEKKFNVSLNVDAKFNPDYNAVMEDLGRKAQEKNPDLSAESIKQNFMDTLAPGKTLEDVWAKLRESKCQTAAIMNGHLRFFAGPAGNKEISLSEFFKSREVTIAGEGTLTHEYLLRKEEMMKQTVQALSALKGELPELPPNKTS